MWPFLQFQDYAIHCDLLCSLAVLSLKRMCRIENDWYDVWSLKLPLFMTVIVNCRFLTGLLPFVIASTECYYVTARCYASAVDAMVQWLYPSSFSVFVPCAELLKCPIHQALHHLVAASFYFSHTKNTKNRNIEIFTLSPTTGRCVQMDMKISDCYCECT